MVRNKGVKVIPVATAVTAFVKGPHKRAGNGHVAASSKQSAASSKPSVAQLMKVPEKRPPKPKIELDLIDPPKNKSLARMLELVLGPSYLAGFVRRNPDGTIAKPKLVVMPKAAQQKPIHSVLGHLLPFAVMAFAIVGLFFEMQGDERILAQLGDPELYVDGAVYRSDQLSSANISFNGTDIYVSGWLNATASGPLVYNNFTCMRPVMCDTTENLVGVMF